MFLHLSFVLHATPPPRTCDRTTITTSTQLFTHTDALDGSTAAIIAALTQRGIVNTWKLLMDKHPNFFI